MRSGFWAALASLVERRTPEVVSPGETSLEAAHRPERTPAGTSRVAARRPEKTLAVSLAQDPIAAAHHRR